MLVIPAIDLKDGQCVRLLQGRKEDSTVYSNDPASTALRWQSMGARLLHVVDLDGAFTGAQRNLSGIKAIREAVSIDIEVGGGIRDMEAIGRLLSMGINSVILGTQAAEEPSFVERAAEKYPGRIIAGIDARDGTVSIKGWVESTGINARDFARLMEEKGVSGVIYTDISRDGMLTGPNIEATRAMVGALGIPVVASGGISTIKDVRELKKIDGLWGAITGKAIYSGSLDLREAITEAGSP